VPDRFESFAVDFSDLWLCSGNTVSGLGLQDRQDPQICCEKCPRKLNSALPSAQDSQFSGWWDRPGGDLMASILTAQRVNSFEIMSTADLSN